MRELKFLQIINKTLSENSLLGEDCAYLKDFNLFITQDTLCEDVHFDLKYTDFYTLAQKAVAVNISDLAANLAEPKYISISLSAPKNINEQNIKMFYKGIEKCCSSYNIQVCGGDLTGSTKNLVISICALGKPFKNAPKVSRSYAKEGQIVCVTKDYGSSAYGLYCLKSGKKSSKEIFESHLLPIPDIKISKILANLKCKKIAIMDSSDGLCDALFKIAKASHITIESFFEKIPYNKEIETYPNNFKDLILWGGEDYGLIFCIDEKDFEFVSKKYPQIRKIGVVKPYTKDYCVKIDDLKIDEKNFTKNCYKHFD